MTTGTGLKLAEDNIGSFSLCPSLPPEKEGGEPRPKLNHRPQDSHPFEMSSWGGLSRDGKAPGDRNGVLIPGPVDIIQVAMSWTLFCPKLTMLGAVGLLATLAPDPGQLSSKKEMGWGMGERIHLCIILELVSSLVQTHP